VTKQILDLTLPRGVLIRGRITEAPSGQPVAGAAIHSLTRGPFFPLPGRGDWDAEAVSGPDGRFALAVPSRTGTLLVKGPTPDYLHVETSDGQFLEANRPGGRRYYPDALCEIDLGPGVKAHDVELTLRRGVTVRGRIAGPGGKPVAHAWLHVAGFVPTGYAFFGQAVAVRGGPFEVRGVDPKGKTRVWFYDPQGERGATLELSGAEREPVEVALKPCGAATVRLIDAQGKPLGNLHPVSVRLLVAPGGEMPRWDRDVKDLAADSAEVGHLVRWSADGDGRRTVRRLIPGATYRIDSLGVPPVDFVAEGGRIKELPDLKLSAKP
jgi:hypothetical protein